MPSNVPTLHSRSGFPASVQQWLNEGDWEGLRKALKEGLPANLAEGDAVSLFESVLAVLEQTGRSGTSINVEPGPIALLEAFVQAGLTQHTTHDGQGTAVSMAVHYGQWGWAHRLMDEGYPVEPPRASVLGSLIDGRLQRAIRAGVGPVLDSEKPSSTELSSNVHWIGTPEQATDDEGPSPVWMADTPEGQAALDGLVQRLVDNGARLNAPESGEGSVTPLARSIANLDRGSMLALIRAGADLSAHVHAGGGRPLELAVVGGSVGLVQALLEAGAPLGLDPNLPMAQALLNHPLSLAAQRGHARLMAPLAQALGEEAMETYWKLAMHLAAIQGHVPVLKALRILGVPYHATTQAGQTALHQAAAGGHPDTIAFLLRRGLKWEATNEAGVSAVDTLRAHHPHLVKAFGLSLGSNVHALPFPRRPKP